MRCVLFSFVSGRVEFFSYFAYFDLFPLLYIQSNSHLNPKEHRTRKIWATETYWQYVKNSCKKLLHKFMALYPTQNPRIPQKFIKDFSFCPDINLACLHSSWMSKSVQICILVLPKFIDHTAALDCPVSPLLWLVFFFFFFVKSWDRKDIYTALQTFVVWFGRVFFNYYFFLITVKAHSSEAKSKGVLTILSMHLINVYIYQITESSGL